MSAQQTNSEIATSLPCDTTIRQGLDRITDAEPDIGKK